MQQEMNWKLYDNADGVAEAVSQEIFQTAAAAIAERGEFKLVLAGGTTPEKIYRLLVGVETDWSKWRIYYGDERCLPADHNDRNSVMAQKALLAHVSIPAENVFSMPAELGPEEAAYRYCEVVAVSFPFDLVLLGMGEDGHTASLFPGHSHDLDELVHAVYDSPKPPPERVSLSANTLGATRRLIFIVTGSSKRSAVSQWRNGADLPVATILPMGTTDIYIDREAMPV